jgi:hypothetical protein
VTAIQKRFKMGKGNWLWIRGGGWSLRGFKSGGVEDVDLYFSRVSLSGKLFAVEEETDSSGVPNSDRDLARCPHGSMCGRDKGFVGDRFAVGGN